MGKSRNQARYMAAFASTSQEEEAPEKAALCSIALRNGLCQCRFAIASWSIKPADNSSVIIIMAIEPLSDPSNYLQTSSRITSSDMPCACMGSVTDRFKQVGEC